MKKKRDEQLIYETALKCFAKFGYKKTTLDMIASELGMTNVNLYCYADSKQALYHDSAAYALTKWQSKVADSIKDVENDPVIIFRALCYSAIQYLSVDEVLCEILKNDPTIFPMFPTVDPYEDINNRSYDLIKSVLKTGIESGCFCEMDIEKCTPILFEVYKTLIIETYLQNDNKDLLDKTRNMIDLFIYGLVKRD